MGKSFIAIFLFLGLNLNAQTVFTQKVNADDRLSIDIKPEIGINKSRTTFNFAGNEKGTNPNIRSELIWKNTLKTNYGASVVLGYKRFYFGSSFLIGQNISGDVSDKDYLKDNRQDLEKQTFHSNHQGNGLIYNINVGYFGINLDKHKLVSFISFEHTRQRNYLLNYKQSQPGDENYQRGLKSYYQYEFNNYGIGQRYTASIRHNFHAIITLEAYLAKYYAYARWNLRSEFQQPLSYDHKGWGFRGRPSAEFTYSFSRYIDLGLKYSYDYFNVNDGKDYLYYTNDETAISKLNNVNIMQHNLSLGLNFKIR